MFAVVLAAVVVIITISPVITVRVQNSGIKRLHAEETDAKYLDSHFCFSFSPVLHFLMWVWSNIARADSKLREDNSSVSFLFANIGHGEQYIFKGKFCSGFTDALVLESEIKENSSKFSSETFYIIKRLDPWKAPLCLISLVQFFGSVFKICNLWFTVSPLWFKNIYMCTLSNSLRVQDFPHTSHWISVEKKT